MNTYSQEYIDKLFDLSNSAELELIPTHYRLFLEKSIEELEFRLRDALPCDEYDED